MLTRGDLLSLRLSFLKVGFQDLAYSYSVLKFVGLDAPSFPKRESSCVSATFQSLHIFTFIHLQHIHDETVCILQYRTDDNQKVS